MSSSDAQRSPVHQSTEDSGLEPTGPAGAPVTPGTDSRGGPPAGADNPPGSIAREAADLKNRPDDAMGVPGNFERGAATAGIVPDTDADANPPGATPSSPGAGNRPRPFNDETKIGTDPDESSYGGPLNLDDPNAV